MTVEVSGPLSGMILIVARVQHEGGASVSSIGGCTGSGIIDASSIELALVDELGRLLSREEEYPCGPALLCPKGVRELAAGQSIERNFVFDGTVWVRDELPNPRNGCDGIVTPQSRFPRCTKMQLPAGRYTVVARYSYCINEREQTGGSVESRVTFEWP